MLWAICLAVFLAIAGVTHNNTYCSSLVDASRNYVEGFRTISVLIFPQNEHLVLMQLWLSCKHESYVILLQFSSLFLKSRQ